DGPAEVTQHLSSVDPPGPALGGVFSLRSHPFCSVAETELFGVHQFDKMNAHSGFMYCMPSSIATIDTGTGNQRTMVTL
ncbi:MAG: hypothetical protein KC488_09090, partial [Candidatus Cloacimonetes bacterium]|nr:hypothetical protein [Candidatus Cloacimonadota bacterium]